MADRRRDPRPEALVGWVALSGLLLVMTFISCTPEGEATSSRYGVLRGDQSVAFSALGWSGDVTVTADSPPAVVRFRLPDGAAQGNPDWYGVRLKFHWLGNPGEPGDFAFLFGGWNGEAVYQFKTKRLSDLDEGFHWSMVDALNGGSHGYESSSSLQVSSTNFAQIRSVQGGWNELKLYLGLIGAGNRDVRVVISKDSEIISTGWGPAHVAGSAVAEVKDEVIDVLVKGRNTGWHTYALDVKAIAWHGYERVVYDWRLGGLGASESFELRRTVFWPHQAPPVRVDVEVDWGSGRQYYVAWDSNAPSGPSFFSEYRFLGSTIGMVVSVVALWVTVPWLWGTLRRSRSR